jgi:hypothetical protein
MLAELETTVIKVGLNVLQLLVVVILILDFFVEGATQLGCSTVDDPA